MFTFLPFTHTKTPLLFSKMACWEERPSMLLAYLLIWLWSFSNLPFFFFFSFIKTSRHKTFQRSIIRFYSCWIQTSSSHLIIIVVKRSTSSKSTPISKQSSSHVDPSARASSSSHPAGTSSHRKHLRCSRATIILGTSRPRTQTHANTPSRRDDASRPRTAGPEDIPRQRPGSRWCRVQPADAGISCVFIDVAHGKLSYSVLVWWTM